MKGRWGAYIMLYRPEPLIEQWKKNTPLISRFSAGAAAIISAIAGYIVQFQALAGIDPATCGKAFIRCRPGSVAKGNCRA
jgi:hypothetical protein